MTNQIRQDSEVIAWAYMVELEDGLSKEQIQKLLEIIPDGIELIPFDLNEGVILTANSIAIGFVNNLHFESLHDIKSVLEPVCNDWKNATKNGIYALPNGEQVLMLCDFETLVI